ncbi:MBL fold metallo-hydrolase [Psychromonas antarctica]|uniref:MBL fold metallo-hydrolase n=1 Tax=Psychromonas antarctica TaxID=67573 RepID=UPI001EE96380|nr:MBL fold metallo-hydrolase [Psychromonas antarctica]MCG6201044.1 MBL fold metallo-hydrolase [Psychromonas antarctica]
MLKLAWYYKLITLAALLTVTAMFLPACSSSYTEKGGSRPKHHEDNGFRNLYIDKKDSSFFGFQKMRYFGEDKWAEYDGQGHLVETTEADIQQLNKPSDSPQFTWIGHSTVLVQYQGINILTDPIFGQRASPIAFAGPKRVTQPAISLTQLPKIDFVLISHNHYDHLDKYTVQKIGNTATWLVPLGYKGWFKNLGVTNVEEFDWWDEKKISAAHVTATPSQHWTARGLNDRYQQLWAAWSVQIGDFKFWFAGDTGYNDKQFKEIGERLGPFDLAIIPIGGYAPRWFMKDMHINPAEALKIHHDVQAKLSLGVHWGTFPLTAEPIDEPVEKLQEATASLYESAFITTPLGKTLSFELSGKK